MFKLDRTIHKNVKMPPRMTPTGSLAGIVYAMEVGDMVYANEREVRAIRQLAYTIARRNHLKGEPPFRIATRHTKEPEGDRDYMIWRVK